MGDRPEIVYKNIGLIKPYEKNPRKNDNAVDAVAESIKQFGFKVPVVIDSKGTIVCGHTRYKAAKKLGIDEIPCIVADDLTEEQITAYRLIDNKTQELSTWDFGKLIAELKELTDAFDMTLLGFDNVDKPTGTSKPAEQNLDEGEELLLDDFGDESFNCTCPCCGFRFND